MASRLGDKANPFPFNASPSWPTSPFSARRGRIGNDFLARKNLLDFVSGDLRQMKSSLGSAQREQLDYHLDALESLSRRWGKLGALKEDGQLSKHAPRLAGAPQSMPDVIDAQFDIATAALAAGLTNVITITSGLGGLGPNYKGFSNMGQHSAGHGNPDPELGVRGTEIVRRAHRFIAERTVDMMKQLEKIPEGKGTMLDNTLIVFMSDSAERQHSHGSQWPLVLLGSLNGKLQTNRLITYPMTAKMVENDYGESRETGTGLPDNPTLNRLYCSLLHAAGAPRENFNLLVPGLDQNGPLAELLA